MQRLTNRGAERLGRELVPLHEDEIEVDVDVSNQNIMDFYKHSPRFASDRAKQWQWIIVSMSISCLVVISALFAYAVFTTTNLRSNRLMLISTIEGASDFAITVSYFIIPGSLAYIGHKRSDLSTTNPFILLFAGFILSCGVTHLIIIPAPWVRFPHLVSVAKLVCAILSVTTAISCYSLIGVALSVPTVEDVKSLERDRQSTHVQLRQLAVHNLSSLLKKADNLYDMAQIINTEFSHTLQSSGSVVYSYSAQEGAHRICGEGEELPDYLPVHMLRDMDSALVLRKEGQDLTGTSLEYYLEDRDYQSVLDPASPFFVPTELSSQLMQLPFRYFLLFVVEQSSGAGKESTSFLYAFESTPASLDFFSAIQLEQLITQVQLAFGKLLQLQMASAQTDILRERNEVLELARDSAEQASQSKSDFLATVSHDIRTPMNAICGMTTVLSDMEGLPSDAQECINIIADSSQVLINLIDDILDFSVIENGKQILNKVIFNLPEEIHRKVNMLRQTIPNKSDLLLHLAPIPKEVPELVIGERNFIGRIISNLLRNAIKFTARGSVILSVACVSKEFYSQVRVDKSTGNMQSMGRVLLRVNVKDTGKGVRQEDLGRLFQPFERLSETTTEGSGLGLTICKKLVEMMGGDIWVESKVGVGSEFGFSVPLEISATSAPLHPTSLDSFGHSTTSSFSRVSRQPTPPLPGSHSSLTPSVPSPRRSSDPRTSVVSLGSVPGGGVRGVVKSEQPDVVLPSRVSLPRDKPPAPAGPSRTLQPGMVPGSFPSPVVLAESGEPPKGPPPPALGLAPPPAEPTSHGRGDIRILVVEDNFINQTVLIKLLKKLGFTNVDTADRGDLGIEKIKDALADERPYSIVFMDVHMPVMGGIEACRIIRERAYPIAHLVACTANVQPRTFQQFAEVGVNDFIPKPINFEKLTRVMEQIEEAMHIDHE